MESGTEGEGRDYTIAAVDRAVNVLEALSQEPNLTLTGLAAKLDLTKSLTFRLLYTLQARGMVIRDADRQTYSLGYRLVFFGDRAQSHDMLLTVAGPIMDELCAATNENVNLVIRDGHACMCVATRESTHSMRLFAQVGRRGPLHAGGASTVLLAYAPTDVQEAVLSQPLKRFNAHTITSPEVLREMLDRIRRNGFHIARNDLDEGAFSLAAPIDDGSGHVIASVSVAGPVVRLDDARQARHIDLVTSAARRISQRLHPGRALYPDTAPAA
jgi:IclR family KDG regulon transcriptional repressor